MSLINLIDADTGKKIVAQIDSDIIPDLRQALLDAVDKLVSDLKGLRITIDVSQNPGSR